MVLLGLALGIATGGFPAYAQEASAAALFWNRAVTSSFRSRNHASERRPWARWIVDFLGARSSSSRRSSSGLARRWAAMPR